MKLSGCAVDKRFCCEVYPCHQGLGVLALEGLAGFVTALLPLLALEHHQLCRISGDERWLESSEGHHGSPRREADSQASSRLQGLLGDSFILRVCRFMSTGSFLHLSRKERLEFDFLWDWSWLSLFLGSEP